MSVYKFVPNEFARNAFNLAGADYVGVGFRTPLEHALGAETLNRHWVAQDPLYGGQREGEVSIILNPDEQNIRLRRFESIGTIYKLS